MINQCIRKTNLSDASSLLELMSMIYNIVNILYTFKLVLQFRTSQYKYCPEREYIDNFTGFFFVLQFSGRSELRLRKLLEKSKNVSN